MKSPVHPDADLVPKEIEPGLTAYQCPQSGGIWIPLYSYLVWREKHPNPEVYAATPGAPEPADDSGRRALICPESGRLLIRYRVGHGLRFHVEQSPVTGGIWLDQGEWEALKSKGLNSQLNLIFTASYQRHVRTEEYERNLEHTFSDRIGADDFQKVVAFKDWLTAHPKRRDICCYLIHDVEQGTKPAN